MKNLPDILYHYTTIETLFKILEEVKNPLDTVSYYTNEITKHADKILLRASLATYMNDPSEFDYLFEGVLTEYRHKEGHIHSAVGESFTQQYRYYGPFVCSFSEEKDSLPMWKEYAQNGKGVAIGFDKAEIHSLRGEESKIGEWQFKRCNYGYDIDKVREELEELKKLGKDIFPESEHSYNYDQAKWEEHEVKTETFLAERAITKHIGYEYEKEWRLYKIFHRPSNPNEKCFAHKYRETNGLIIPYEEIPIPVNAIKEIVIGPTTHHKKVYDSIEMYLKSRGMDASPIEERGTVWLHKSEIPHILL